MLFPSGSSALFGQILFDVRPPTSSRTTWGNRHPITCLDQS